MCRVDNNEVDTSFHECHGASERVFADANSSTNREPPLRVLCCQRVLVALGEVLHRDEAAQSAIRINNGDLLDLVALHQRERIVGRDAYGRGNQRHLRHDIANACAAIIFELHVTVGDDAHEDTRIINDRQT